MPSRKFWKEVVRSVFDLNDKNRLRKAKVMHGAAYRVPLKLSAATFLHL